MFFMRGLWVSLSSPRFCGVRATATTVVPPPGEDDIPLKYIFTPKHRKKMPQGLVVLLNITSDCEALIHIRPILKHHKLGIKF